MARSYRESSILKTESGRCNAVFDYTPLGDGNCQIIIKITPFYGYKCLHYLCKEMTVEEGKDFYLIFDDIIMDYEVDN